MSDTEKFFQLIREKHERLLRLRDFSQRQLQFVDEENMNALLELLAAKQKLLIEMEGADNELKKYRVDDPDQRIWTSPELRNQCREAVSQCDRLIREILETDHLAEQQLIEKKERAGQLLKQFDNSARVQNAYRQQKKHSDMTKNGGTHYRIDFGAE